MQNAWTHPQTPDDLIALGAQAATGRRPEFTGDPLTERLFAIVLSLTTELAVTRERLDTVERLLEQHGLVPRRQIDEFAPDAPQAAERGQLQQEYLARVFRVLLQDDGQPVPGSSLRLAPGDRRAA